jgi:hypothetical protein
VLLAAVLGLGYVYYANRETPSEPPIAAAPEPESFNLANGLSAELARAECNGQIALAALFSVGTDHDPPERSGMTQLIERVLSSKLAAPRAFHGGSDHSLYAVSVGADGLSAELDALASLLTRLEIDDAALAAAKTALIDSIQARSGGDPALTARTLAAEAIAPSPGKGRRGGIVEEIEVIERSELEAFWHTHFAPKNLRLTLVGAIGDGARAQIERAFAPLAAGKPPATRPPTETKVIGTLVMGDAPSAIAIAVPVPPPSDASFPTFLLLAAAVSATYDPLVHHEMLFVDGSVATGEAAEPAAARVRAELDAKLDQGDVAIARKRFDVLLGHGGCDDPRRLALARARRAQLGLDARRLDAQLDAVSEESRAAAVALFDTKHTTAVIAGGAIR